MILELIEKYFNDVEGQPVWEWLEIAQTSWSYQKRTGLSKLSNDKLCEHFNVEKLDSKELAFHIVDTYYKM